MNRFIKVFCVQIMYNLKFWNWDYILKDYVLISNRINIFMCPLYHLNLYLPIRNMNVAFETSCHRIFFIFFQIYHSYRKSSLLCWNFCWEEQMLEISLILMVPLLQSSQTMSAVIGSVWQKWRHHTAAFLELVNLC